MLEIVPMSYGNTILDPDCDQKLKGTCLQQLQYFTPTFGVGMMNDFLQQSVFLCIQSDKKKIKVRSLGSTVPVFLYYTYRIFTIFPLRDFYGLT